MGVLYLEKVHEHRNDLPFLSERMKMEKVEKLVANLHDKSDYVIHIRKLKQVLNHGLNLVFQKVHKAINFNRNAWLKWYIYINTDLKKEKQKWFRKRFF